VSRRGLLVAVQVAVNDALMNCGLMNPELNSCSQSANLLSHRCPCGQPARLPCAPAAGSAGYAGSWAELTLPRRRTSAAMTVMSGGMAGQGTCGTATRRSGGAN
jgi:hypothetical protein